MTGTWRCLVTLAAVTLIVDLDATGIGRTVRKVIDGNLGDDPSDLYSRVVANEAVGRCAVTPWVLC